MEQGWEAAASWSGDVAGGSDLGFLDPRPPGWQRGQSQCPEPGGRGQQHCPREKMSFECLVGLAAQPAGTG